MIHLGLSEGLDDKPFIVEFFILELGGLGIFELLNKLAVKEDIHVIRSHQIQSLGDIILVKVIISIWCVKDVLHFIICGHVIHLLS